MRRAFSILLLNVKSFFKSPGVIVLMFVMPVVFSWIFGGMSVDSEKSKPLVNIVVANNETSKAVTKLLTKEKNFHWKQEGIAQARKNVSAQKAIAAIVVPEDIERRMKTQQPLFEVIVQKKTEDYLALEPYLQGTAQLVRSSYTATESQQETGFTALLTQVAQQKGVTIEQQTVQKNTDKLVGTNLMIVGFAMMFMMFGLSGAASIILDEKKGGTWRRLFTSPARKIEIIGGYLGAYFLLGWIQFSVLLIAMKWMFQTSWGNLLYLIPFTSLVIITIVGFGLMVAGLVKTKQQATAMNSVIIVSSCMLGGVYWPLDIVPEIMQKVALGVPQSWAMSGFKEIISGSLHLGTLLEATLALVGFSLAFYIIGLRGMKYE
ncbi:ABC transporter permease [Bacillus rubiinfantis]|uniref:ABC transporter permease n=1 Tax=Bacillus rubiinfantis TaxID=1499680 RepID=UPI0005A76ABD|nr:ABC transporter permease [Bacillus rubiinfantis]